MYLYTNFFVLGILPSQNLKELLHRLLFASTHYLRWPLLLCSTTIRMLLSTICEEIAALHEREQAYASDVCRMEEEGTAAPEAIERMREQVREVAAIRQGLVDYLAELLQE